MWKSFIYCLLLIEYKNNSKNIYLYNILTSKHFIATSPAVQIEIQDDGIKIKLISDMKFIHSEYFPNYTNEQFLEYIYQTIYVVCKIWNQLIKLNYINKTEFPIKFYPQDYRDDVFAERELKNTNEINYVELFSSAFEITDEGKKFLDSLGQK